MSFSHRTVVVGLLNVGLFHIALNVRSTVKELFSQKKNLLLSFSSKISIVQDFTVRLFFVKFLAVRDFSLRFDTYAVYFFVKLFTLGFLAVKSLLSSFSLSGVLLRNFTHGLFVVWFLPLGVLHFMVRIFVARIIVVFFPVGKSFDARTFYCEAFCR